MFDMAHSSPSNRSLAAGSAVGSIPAPVSGTAEGTPLLTFEAVRENARVKIFVRKADEALAEIGYTEHGERHVGLVAHIAYNILKRLGHPEREAELAAIAGYLHDIGNGVNREHHAQTSAVMAMGLLEGMGMGDLEIIRVMGAIGNHHENDGDPVSPVAAAVILADKSDVHRTRVRNPDMIKFDIHDRVNYAVEKSFCWTVPTWVPARMVAASAPLGTCWSTRTTAVWACCASALFLDELAQEMTPTEPSPARTTAALTPMTRRRFMMWGPTLSLLL
jgi:hypothetical protein